MSNIGPNPIAVTTDGAEGRRTVNVPGDLVEDGFEHVHGHEADAALHQPPRQQAALAEAVQAVTLANVFRLLSQVEGLARCGGGHERVGLMECGIHQLRVLIGFLEVGHRLIDHLAPVAAAVHTHGGDVIRWKHVRHFEVRIGRVSIQYEGIVSLAQETRRVTMRQVATQARQLCRGSRHWAACRPWDPFSSAQHTTIVGRFQASLE